MRNGRKLLVSAVAMGGALWGASSNAEPVSFSVDEFKDRAEAPDFRWLNLYWRDVLATGSVDLSVDQNAKEGSDAAHGRISAFATGLTAGGTKVTASIDTRDQNLDDVLRHLDRRDPDQALREIEDRDVWVTTGDDSSRENLAPTSGRLYLKVERDENYAMWGDFKPDADLSRIVRTDRTLYGAAVGWKSETEAQDGSPSVAASAYAGQADRLTQRDVFRGTGGSAYFLSRRGVEAETETVIVEIRDPVSGRVVSSRQLTRGMDYRIDTVQGVVILNKPLPPYGSSASLLSTTPSGDLENNLVVQYDYVPTGGAALANTVGGRVESWITPALRLGVSAAVENTGEADNRLLGADVLLKRSETTYLSAEVAQSEGPGLLSRPSLNGGLDLDPAEPVAGQIGRPATGLEVEGRLDLAEIGQEGHLRGWYELREAGFWSPDHNAVDEQRAMGLAGELMTSAGKVSFAAEEAREGADNLVRKGRIGIDGELRENLTLGLEVAHQDRRQGATQTYEAENGSLTDLGAKLTWQRSQETKLWVFGQGNIARTGTVRADNRIGAGAELLLTDTLDLTVEASTGTLGEAGEAELAWRPTEGATYRLGISADPAGADGQSRGASRSATFGADQKLNDRWTATGETVATTGASQSVVNAYGLSHESGGLRTDFGILAGDGREIDGTTIERHGLSFGLARGEEDDGASYKIRAEYRQDRTNNPDRFARIDSWLLTGTFTQKISESARVFGQFDAVLTDNKNGAEEGHYVEARLGYGYRPIADDRLNILLSYTWLEDKPGADQTNVDGTVGGPAQRSHIINAALSYDLDERFTLGAKYGFRNRTLLDEASAQSSNAHLGILRLEYRVATKWDAIAEVRTLHETTSGTTTSGAMIGLYREVSSNARLGVGYNWGGVSEDLRRVTPEKDGLFLNVIAKF